jgi:ATP-dependent helicase/nuclease subunit B
MSLQFIFGGPGKGKSYYLQHFILKEAKLFPERQYLFVVPEQFTMQTQKELIAISDEKGIMNIDVQSFLRLAFRVLAETGTASMPILDDMGKTMILKKVLANLEEELTYFGRNIHKKGYVLEIKSFVSELMQYGADETVVEEMIQKADRQPVLRQKLTDIKKIYKAFVEYLSQNYITSEEILTVLTKVTKESEILKDSVVCLDGFTGFTPTQYQFIEQLLCVARKVYISVTIAPGESVLKVGAEHKLFHMSQKTICRLRKLAKGHRVEVEEDIWVGEDFEKIRFAMAPGVRVLEEQLFRYPFSPCHEKVEDVTIHVLKQPEEEVAFAVEQISNLLRKEDCRYRDIAVVAGDLEVYGKLAKELFAQNEIPCFVDQKKSILLNPYVDMLSAVIDIFLTNFEMQKVIRFEKNLFSTASLEQCNLLDNFLRATGIRGYRKWCEVWDPKWAFRNLSKEMHAALNVTLDTIRQETLDQLGGLYEQIGRGKHTVREYAQAFCEWMEEEKHYLKIQEMVETFTQQGERDLAREYSQIYEIVLGVFERLVELLGDEEMNLREFKEIIDTGFSEARIGLIPPGVDQVVVGDMIRTRLANIKYLFFLGMNDNNVPKSGSHGGVLSDSERLFLAQEEFELAPTVRENVYMEQFYLYLNLTKPSRHLYLTFCESGNDGKALNPSYMIDKVQKILPKVSIRVEDRRQDDSYLLGTSFGKEYLIQGLRNREDQTVPDKWKEVFAFYNRDPKRKKELEDLIEAAFYRETETKLSKEAVRALYHNILTGSTSQFERYAACAFSYFLQYGLHLRERQEHQVEFFDIGNIVHEALELYTRQLITEKKKWQDISEKEQHVRANQCINSVVERYREGILYDTERDTYLINRLRRILHRTIHTITRQMEAGSFDTVDSEVGFELLKNVSETKEQDLLRLIGRIDRVDRMEEEGSLYVKIVDYKTGKKALSLSDLYYGLQMQLMIYLKATVEETQEKTKKLVVPAAVLYYNIDDPMVETMKQDQKQINNEIFKQLRMEGLVNEDDPVLPALDHCFESEEGTLPLDVSSDVIPVATDKKGQLKKASKTLQTKDFETLMQFTDKKLKEIHDAIQQGEISINPYRRNDASGETACQYCPYHSVCRFDIKIPGNHYRVFDKMTEDMVLYEAAKKINGEEKEDSEAAKEAEEKAQEFSETAQEIKENNKEQDFLQQTGELEKGGEK